MQERSCARLNENYQCLTPWSGHRRKLCGRAGFLLWMTKFLARKPLPATSGLGGTQVSDTQSTLLHPAMSCSWGRAARLVWESWLLLPCVLHGALGSASIKYLRPQTPYHVWENEVGKGWQQSRGCSAQLLPVAGRGWVLAAKQESKWKTMTYRKLCEARLVSEDYR